MHTQLYNSQSSAPPLVTVTSSTVCIQRLAKDLQNVAETTLYVGLLDVACEVAQNVIQ